MYGAIIGDICGSIYEWHNRKTNNPEAIELINSDCRFTDDTVLTCAVAEALLTDGNYKTAVYKWANKYPLAGYGEKFTDWFYSKEPQAYDSWGNGSAMRVSAVGWVESWLDSVLSQAERSAEFTHNHPEGIKGAQAVAAAVCIAKHSDRYDDSIDGIWCDNEFFITNDNKSEYASLKEEIKHFIEKNFGYNLSRALDEIRPDYTFKVSCQDSVPVAIIAFLESKSFEHAIQLAISVGGDSDTIACITGSIAEAYYKYIPKNLIKFAQQKITSEMQGLLNDFYVMFPQEGKQILPENAESDDLYHKLCFRNLIFCDIHNHFDDWRKRNVFLRKLENLVMSAENDDAAMLAIGQMIHNRYAYHERPETLFELAQHYLKDNSDPQIKFRAFALFLYLAVSEHEPAYAEISKCYAYGIGTPRNIGRVFYWFERSENKDAEVLAFIGSLYRDGTEVPQDKQKAILFLVAAADAGHKDTFNLYSYAANEGDAHAQYMLFLVHTGNAIIPADIQTGLRWLQKSAEQGYAPAQSYLGAIHLDGLFGVEPDPQIAVQWFRLTAKQGDEHAEKYRARCSITGSVIDESIIDVVSDAEKYLARCFITGSGIERDVTEAIRIWKKYAQDHDREKENRRGIENVPGDMHCQYMLSQVLLDETRPEFDPKEGIKWLRKSAQQGLADAQTKLAICLLNGDKIKQNINDARNWFHKAAQQNNAVAQFHLAEIYAEGKGIPASRKEAFKWYNKSAELGYVPSMQIVAELYLRGVGTAKDESAGYTLLSRLALHGDEEAFTLLKSAAASGNAVAQYLLSGYWFEKDNQKSAISWLEKSAEQNLAVAQRDLAFVYQRNEHYEKVAHYLQLAAEQGDSEAQVHLALIYEGGFYVKKDLKLAFKWMKKAAQAGHVQAAYFLGNLYRDGTGTQANPMKAFEYYSKAAEGGSSDGIDRLGCCYRLGIGVEPNMEIAFKLYQRAAQMGNPKGQYNLGRCYLQGNGCEQNDGLAFKWISLAAQSGHPAIMHEIESLGPDFMVLLKNLEVDRTQQPQYAGNYFERSLDQALQSGIAHTGQVIPPSEQIKESLSTNNKTQSEQIPSTIQETAIWSDDVEYTGLPDGVKVWNVNFYVKNKDYYDLVDAASREQIKIDQILERRFFNRQNVFLDHFGGRIPNNLSPDSAWIASIVVGSESAVGAVFAGIAEYMKQSGAAKGYEDLQYLPFSNQQYVGYVESLDKKTKYRYRFIGDILQRFKIPHNTDNN
ncbi:MAG: ADP-ribosylglycohydrolase family protein [Planctomycetaceae bacterium]|jgi:TPR repeat protein/ADP-ribosylglycohydrolase|nr:ADP-ribosylglycohydrolase family protein [Planctomycetaceae bacterium]